MIALLYVAVVLVGYLLGSIPFGLLIARTFAKTDIRLVGSGKTGMTNVMRAAGKKAAALSLLLDMTKGALSVIVAMLLFNTDFALASGALPWTSEVARVLAALAAIGGHSWSVFLRFRGGRGVATFFGGLVALCPVVALFGGEIIFLGFVSRYMSLGSITGAVAALVMCIVLFVTKSYPVEYLAYTVYAMICSIFIFLMHRDNIIRLVSGTERRLGEKAASGNPVAGDHK